jgi:ATP-binding cassette subfamily B protein
MTAAAALPARRRLVAELRHNFRHFWPYVRERRLLVAGSFAALLCEIGMRLLEPWPLKLVFDRVFAESPPGRLRHLPILSSLSPMALLAAAALAIVLITGLRSLAAYANTVGFATIGNHVLSNVRRDLYERLQGLSLSFHSKARSGDLLVRVTRDVDMLTDVTVTAVLPLLVNFSIMTGMVGLMFFMNWRLALAAMACAPLFWISATRLTGKIREASRSQRQREGAMAATAAESFGAMKVVQALSLEGEFRRAFSKQNVKSLTEGVKSSRLAARLERTVDLLIAISTALVLWYGARLVIRRSLSPGELLVFLAYLKSTFKPVQDFAKYTGRLGKASAAGERVVDLLERTPEIHDLPGAVAAPAFRGAVRFVDVGVAYEPGQHVLRDVTFDVAPGQSVALAGRSGAGKSTLASLLLRLYDPVEGRVEIDGRDVREYTLASLRSQISVVLQDTVLFAASVRDNIAFGAPGTPPEEIEAAARLANAHEFIEALPEGYDTVLGERGVTLSGGERQRIAIARAAVRRAPIVILDEPTTGLDESNARAVTDAFERLARGPTTVLITHDLARAARADLIVLLDEGRVQERGTHAELLERNGLYAALYRLQTADESRPERREASPALAS